MTEETIFHEALAKAPAERAAFLNQACAGKPELRAAVEALLAAHGDSHGLLDRPTGEWPRAAAPEHSFAFLHEQAAEPAQKAQPTLPPTPLAEQVTVAPDASGTTAVPIESGTGAVIAGRYTLEKLLGEGGMGQVWVAQQTEPVKRLVALKLIKGGMDSKAVLQRFEQERQALAIMDHPNIAKVLDGGLVGQTAGWRPEAGGNSSSFQPPASSLQPFFVMELVNGLPLTKFCDEMKLTPRERLELFVPICQAVQHAHQKGVVHRDLKPANILVMMVDGKPVPKVIDFGVAKALNAKLTEESLATQFGAVVGTLEYMAPEQAGYSGQDVDTRADIYSLGVILYELLTGLRPFDGKRFRQAALFDMIRILLEEEPSKPSTQLSTAEGLPSLAATRQTEPKKLMAMLRGELDWVVMKCLEKQRDRRYETANGLARDIQRYLADEPVEARPPSRTYRASKFLRRHKGPVLAVVVVLLALVGGMVGTSVGLYQANVARKAEAEQRRLAEAAAVQEAIERKRAEDVATLMESVFDGIDPTAEAETGLSFKEQLVAKLDVLTKNLENFAGDSQARARLQFSFGKTLLALAEYARAEKLLESAVTLSRTQFGPNDPRTLQAEFLLAATYEHLGRFDEAVALVENLRARAPSAPDDSDYDHDLGMIYQFAGRLEKALPLFEAACKRIKPGPDTTYTLLKLHTLGAAYRESGRLAEAIPMLEDVHARRAKLLGADHPDTLWTANSLAVAYAEAGQAERALKLYEDTRQRLLKRFAPDHASVLNTVMNQAQTMSKAGQLPEAITLLEQTRDRAVAKLGANNPYALRTCINLASVYYQAGRYDAARQLFEQVLPPLTAAFGLNNRYVLQTQLNLARCYRNLRRYPDAVRLLEPTLDYKTKQHGADHPDTLKLRAELAMLLRNTTEPAKAIAVFQQVLDKQRQIHGPRHPDTLSTQYGLGAAYFSTRQAKEAIAVFEQLLPRQRELLGPEHPETLMTQSSLGASYWLNKQLDKSVPLIEETLHQEEKVLGSESPSTLSTAENLAINYEDAKQFDKLFGHLQRWLPRLMKAKGPEDRVTGRLVNSFLRACQNTNRMGEAVAVLEILHESLVRRLGADHPGTLQIMNNLGTAYWAAGRLDKSVPMFEDLVRRTKKQMGEAHPETLQRMGSLARNLLDAGRAQEAVTLLTGALQHGRSGTGELPPGLDFLQRDLVQALAKTGQRDQALTAARKYVEEARSRQPADSPAWASSLAGIGMTLLQLEAYAEAEPLLRECLAIRAKSQPESWQTFNTQSMLGGALLGLKKYAEAEPLLLQGYQEMKQRQKSMPPQAQMRLTEALERLVRLYEATGKTDEAAKWRKELEATKAAQAKPENKP